MLKVFTKHSGILTIRISFFSVLLIFCDYWCRVTEQWLLQVPKHHNRKKTKFYTLNQKLSNQNFVLDAQSLHKAQWYSNRSYIFFFSVLLIFCDYWCRVTEQWLLQVPQHHNRQKLQNFTCYCSIQFVSMIVALLSCNRSKNNNLLVLEF